MTVSGPDCARHATISWPKYVIRWTSPNPISADHATWNHPVGFIDSGGFAISVSSPARHWAGLLNWRSD
jgi:hypothetical protein